MTHNNKSNQSQTDNISMKILITGASGNLGMQLRNKLSSEHTIIGADIVGDNVESLDITDYAACQDLMQSHQPDIVLHPAAWTDVNGCALNPQQAIRVNGVGTHNIAVTTAQLNVPIVYVSSNEVFDGQLNRPYTEFDQTNPINPYAYSKWYGERAVQQVNPKHYIVRTAWLFAHGGRNFIQAILNAANAGKTLRVVTNEVANPTYTNDVADAIAQLITSERYGIYHFVNQGAVSRWEFARYVLDQAGYQDTPIARISRHEWQRPSLPPEYTPLDNIAGASIGITLRSWRDAVDDFLSKENL
jgi:dTDP-4-dehydrorhamnose reductase